NVIYAAISLLALQTLRDLGQGADTEGIVELIRSFKGTIPGRSWIGYTASDVKGLAVTDEPINPDQLSVFVLQELSAFEVIYRADAHSYLSGNVYTFSLALNFLTVLGYSSLFQGGIPPLLRLVYALRASRHIENGSDVRLVSPVDRLPLRQAE